MFHFFQTESDELKKEMKSDRLLLVKVSSDVLILKANVFIIPLGRYLMNFFLIVFPLQMMVIDKKFIFIQKLFNNIFIQISVLSLS